MRMRGRGHVEEGRGGSVCMRGGGMHATACACGEVQESGSRELLSQGREVVRL